MFNRLKNALWLIVAGVVAVWAVTSLVGLVRAGPMEPPAAPGPTNRTPIFQPDPGGFPIVIDQPGSYYLASNITGESGANGIEIASDDVTLDLNGFTLQGMSGSGNGITTVVDFGDSLTIYDGTVRDWGVNGVYAMNGRGSRFDELKLMWNGDRGLAAVLATVTHCTATHNTWEGFDVSDGSIVNSSAEMNGGTGIRGGYLVVSNCYSYANDQNGISVWESTVSNCTSSSNTNDGIEVYRDSLVTGNVAYNNYAIGIHATSTGNRVEGNNATENTNFGIKVDVGGNIAIKNSAYGNGTDYSFAATSAAGPIVDCTGGCTINADASANVRY
jgi:parallel beta-helix repeat protein